METTSMSINKLSRREFVRLSVASGAMLGLGNHSEGATLWIPQAGESVMPPFDVEAARLTTACMGYWDKTSAMFRAPVLSAETVPSDALHDRGYTLWPSPVALHALVEGEKAHSGQYTSQIAMVYDGLEQYYSDDLHAYSSWVHFPGNIDAYYDDNSWAVIVLVESSLACKQTFPTRSAQYLNRAQSVMADYVVNGYDVSEKPGGTRWGTDTTKPNTSDRGTSSTAGSALAALMLARAGVKVEFYTRWGHDLLSWLMRHLLDTDSLVIDALSEPDWKARRIKWTYNTGVPMRAYVEHYRLTKDPNSLSMATHLARSALNVRGGLFDSKVHDAGKRFYWDGTYFVHYLIDGLLQVALASSDTKLVSDIVDIMTRTARYTYTFLRDPTDGFYWRNMRLYTIGASQHETWQKWTGQTIAPDYDASERSQEAKFQALPVKERPLVKTLLANAGTARLFWLTSQLTSTY